MQPQRLRGCRHRSVNQQDKNQPILSYGTSGLKSRTSILPIMPFTDDCNIQVMVSEEPRWVPAKVTVPKNSERDASTVWLMSLKKRTFPRTQYVCKKVPSFINFSGLVGQPVAQGALELNCSFLQLKHNRTSLLWCDRKELRLFAPCFSLDMIRKKIKNLSIDKTNTLERFTLSLSEIWSLFHGHFYRIFLET